jgi:predicted phosphodiesterase
MSELRIIGDVHGQIDLENLTTRGARPYLDIIREAPYSVQIGDMGDAETYAQLMACVDPIAHRFVPGNHDHYHHLPEHCLGDFGSMQLGGVEFCFVRGAASWDREKLIQLGRKLGKTLWYEQEELTATQMRCAEQAYLHNRPRIMLTHDAPTEIARFAWRHARSLGPPRPDAEFRPSRTNEFLQRLLGLHAPALWLFGHHHRDWQYQESDTRFVCVGELCHIDITPDGSILRGSSL